MKFIKIVPTKGFSEYTNGIYSLTDNSKIKEIVINLETSDFIKILQREFMISHFTEIKEITYYNIISYGVKIAVITEEDFNNQVLRYLDLPITHKYNK